MKTFGWVMITSSFVAVAACGSHNHAPVVYGADPARQTRVYHSPEDIRRDQQPANAQTAQAQAYQKPVYQPRSSAVEPVQLTPVSAVYLDEPQRQEVRATGIRNASAVAAPPAHLHKAKGYVQVERGDTVYAIARRFNVSPSSIIDANDLKKPYALQVGQALKLPSGATAMATDAPSRSSATQPVSTRRVVAQDRLYEVRGGDTLYSISRSTGVSVNNIASANRLRAPYALNVGQQLLIPQAPAGGMVASSRSAPATPPSAAATAPEDLGEITRNASYTPPPAAVSPASMFEWPVRGAIVSEYGSGNLGRRNDGVNIAAPVGAPVRAAADGQVVYRGSELEGFGNLLLIKHRDGFVTAYAHNDSMLVKKGDQVRKGQVISKVGATGAVTTSQLHFEIRQESQPVDPVALLGKP